MFYYTLTIIAILLYIFAPQEYSHIYNICILLVYVFSFVAFAKKEKIKALSYPTLFFFIFFFVNFAYPVFIYPFDSTFILQYRYSFSTNYINSGSALSLVAFTIFICGYIKRKKNFASERHYILNRKNYTLFLILSFGVLLYNLILIIPQIGISYADAKVPFQTGSLFVMLESTLALLQCFSNRNELRGNSKLFFYSLRFHIFQSSIFSLGCLLLGSREYVLTLVLLFAILYSHYVKPIQTLKMLGGLLIGIMAFYFISQVRNNSQISSSKELFELKSWQNGKVSGAWNLASDLIINNRNLYVGMQYVDDSKHGYTYGYNYIPNILSPIPFLPSLFTKYILETSVVDLTSQQMLTNYTRDDLGESSLDYELGTNCVVDVYMAFGLLGVIVFFYCLGIFIKYLEVNMSSNVKTACAYIVLFTGIVFFCRSSFLGPVKNLVWAYWVCCFCLYRIKDFSIAKNQLTNINSKQSS